MPSRRGALAFIALMAGSCSDPAQRSVTATVEQAVAGTWSEASAGPNPPMRWGHSSDWDPSSGRTLLFGGTGITFYNDTWAWDGGSWTEICDGTTCSAPATRLQAGMVYDLGRGEMVMYGGLHLLTPMNDTWTLVGNTWAQRCANCLPAGRTNMGMAFDRGRGVIVLFGGSDEVNTWYGDTFEWNGSTWIQRCASPACGPCPREGPAVAWDGNRIILMGGNDGGVALNDTWAWNADAGVWNLLSPTSSPTPRENSAVAFDSVRNRVIVFGGANNGVPAPDTWEWDGLNWTQTNDGITGSAPSPRYGVSMAFDPIGDDAVIMGGTRNGASDDADTWLYVGPPGGGGADAGGLPNGTPCLDAGICASGFCTDGVCCPVACGGQCQSCAGGTCMGIDGAPDGGRPACNGFGACQGTCVSTNPSSCTYPGSGTTCASPLCAGTTHEGPGGCDGTGGCFVPTVDCAPYACQFSGCLVTCASDVDCAPGNCCSAPQCTLACTADGGSPDAGTFDGGSADAGAPDAGSLDAGSFDGGTDAGLSDAGASDAGPADAGLSPSAADLGCGCGSSPGAGWLFLAVAASAVSGRRRRKRTLAGV